MRIVLWGFGTYGQEIARQLYERGIELIGIIDRRPTRLGRDAAEIACLPLKSGITVSPPEDAVQLLRHLHPDACIVCTRTSLADVYDQLEVSARCSVDCITLSEEAFYPWHSSPELAGELDRLARENDCTISASGANDTLLAWLPKLMISSVNLLSQLTVVIQYNVDLDRRLAAGHGVGLPQGEFEKTIGSSNNSYFSMPVVDWLSAACGFETLSRENSLNSVQALPAVHSSVLGAPIEAGENSGACEMARVKTREGPILECRCIERVFGEGDEDFIECSVSGTPDLKLKIPMPDHVRLTCASLINRLGQLVSAPAGAEKEEERSLLFRRL